MSSYTVILERPMSIRVVFETDERIDVYIAEIPDAKDTLDAVRKAQAEVFECDKLELRDMHHPLHLITPELKPAHYKMVCVLEGLPKVLHISFD